MNPVMEQADSSEPLIDPLDNGDSVFQRRPLVGGVLTNIVYPFAIVVVFGFALSGSLVDQYFASSGTSFSLKLPDGEARIFKVPPTVIHSVHLHTQTSGGEVNILEYSEGQATLDPAELDIFEDKLINMNYVTHAWATAKVLGYMVIVFSGIACGFQLLFREVPSTHAFKPESFVSSVGWKNSVPVWLMLGVSFLGISQLLLVVSFVQPLMTRLALASVRFGLSNEEWLAFLTAFEYSTPRGFQLDTLQSLGSWYADRGTAWSFSTISILVAILISNVVFIAVFYSDVRLVRTRLGVDTSIDSMRQQLKSVPKTATILPLWVSVVFFGTTMLITSMVARLVLNAGKSLNRLPYVAQTPDMVIPIDDIVLSHTGMFWFASTMVVDGTILGWIPLVAVVALGSVDRMACLSKVIQSLALGYLLRIPSIFFTELPTTYSVLQDPQCYTTEHTSFWAGLIRTNFCNDMVYSGHASLVVTPALIIITMIVYGPYLHKAVPIFTVSLAAFFGLMVIVVGRLHYTADVLLTVMICTLITIVNAPAWKVIFSYSQYQLRIGSAKSVTRVAALLEEVCDRVVSISKSRRIDYNLTDWNAMDQRMAKLRTLIDNASSDMKLE